VHGSLRVLARLLALSSCVLCSSAARADRLSVALDFSGLDEKTYRELDALALEKSLVLRLVQEGYAVVGRDTGPDLAVRFSVTADSVVLEIGDTNRISVPRRGARPMELQLEIAHKLAELVRVAEIQRAAQRTTTPPIAAPALAPTLSRAPVPIAPVPRVRGELDVGLDALWRGGGVDPLVRIAGSLTFARGLRLYLESGVAPSIDTSIHVVEWQLQTGAGYRFTLRRYLSFELGALVGFLLHHYAVEGVSDSGARVDFLASLPLSLRFWPTAHLSLALRAAPGIANEARTHEVGDEILWTRSAWRVETGGSVAWSW
jgi:hypothetical protein